VDIRDTPEYKALEAQVGIMKTMLDGVLNERHAARVAKVFDLKTLLGLVKNENFERERLGKLSDDALSILENELSAFASRVAAFQGSAVPFGEGELMNSEEEQVRERLYGYRRDAKQLDTTTGLGKIVGA
jgi:hypothetical protein